MFDRDLIFDERYAYRKTEQTPALIADLLAIGVDVLVTPMAWRSRRIAR